MVRREAEDAKRGRSRGHGRRALAGALGLIVVASGLSGCKAGVPLAGGRNFLGTGSLTGFGTGGGPRFWLSVSGQCNRRENGDALMAYADNTGGAASSYGGAPDPHSCLPAAEGGPSYVRKNPMYDANGYLYRVDVPAGAPGPVAIEVYDPVDCNSQSTPGSTLAQSGLAERTTFRLYRTSASSPPVSTDIAERTFVPGDCALANTWWSVATVEPADGPFFLQVKTLAPASSTANEGNNQFALRAFAGTWAPCASDATIAGNGVAFDPSCPQITAVGSMGVYLTISGGLTTLPVTSLTAAQAGKTLDVEIFDAAEKSQFIELLDPNGDPATFNAEIACDDGRYLSQIGGASCTTGETAPTPNPADSSLTYGPWTTNKFDLCGPVPNCGAGGSAGTDPSLSAQQVWGFSHLVQRTQYSDRTLRLTVTMPADYAATYGDKTRWSIRVTNAVSAFSDRMTIKASTR